MEKTTPERKVLLRENDIFYVYDKRINKCIKEDCDGTVKYGLNLKVNMPNGDTLNTYECNKCHMKYTAYPNYVRLTKTDYISIYNYEEVVARDKKRADDAAKQAAKERKKKNFRTGFNKNDTGVRNRSYERYSKKDGSVNYGKRNSYNRNNYDKNSGYVKNENNDRNTSYDRNENRSKNNYRRNDSYNKKNYTTYSGNGYKKYNSNYNRNNNS